MKCHVASMTALFLTACGQTAIHEVQNKVVSDFLDPDSAQFTNTQTVNGELGTYVCGEVNGKNVFGAYTGRRRYWGVNAGGVVTAEIVEDASESPCDAFQRLKTKAAADDAANAFLNRQFEAAQRDSDCKQNGHCVDEYGLINSM